MRAHPVLRKRPVHETWVKLLYSGFETCFGWDPIATYLKSRCCLQAILEKGEPGRLFFFGGGVLGLYIQPIQHMLVGRTTQIKIDWLALANVLVPCLVELYVVVVCREHLHVLGEAT